jgi:hypothetical protein
VILNMVEKQVHKNFATKFAHNILSCDNIFT